VCACMYVCVCVKEGEGKKGQRNAGVEREKKRGLCVCGEREGEGT